MNELNWDLPDPYVIEHSATEDEIDGYGHINNSVYLQWMDRCVWEHCDAVNMSQARCRALGKGYAAVRHEIDYLAATYAGDQLSIANWVTLNDGKLRAERRFQIIRHTDLKTVLRAHSYYVCTDLVSGRVSRIPPEFVSGFAVLDSVAKALEKI